MKTALQQLIEDFEESYSTAGTEVERIIYRVCIEKARALLDEEREQIERAFNEGSESKYGGELYYKETFEQ